MGNLKNQYPQKMGIQGTDGRLPGSEGAVITQWGSHEIWAEASVIMTALVTTLIVLSVVLLTSLIAGAILLLRKYSSSRGDYYTQVHKYFKTFNTFRMTLIFMTRRMRVTSLLETQTLQSSRPRRETKSRWEESGSFDLARNVVKSLLNLVWTFINKS